MPTLHRCLHIPGGCKPVRQEMFQIDVFFFILNLFLGSTPLAVVATSVSK